MEGIIRIDKVVALFEVWLGAEFPFAKMKVKVVQRSVDDFLAVPNLARRDVASGGVDYTSGLGDTVEEALNDLLIRFVSEIRINIPNNGLTESDFEWSSPDDF